MHTLQTLQLLGLDPASASARRAIALVAENGRWEHAGQRYFDGEVEPCINGRTIETGAYFGVDVAPIVERILGERLADGGWNCEVENGSVRSSFDTTINVLDGLLEFERATGGSAAVREARRGGEEYLLERGLFRGKSTGEVVDPAYLDFAFPYYWHYDVLRALDYFRRAGAAPIRAWRRPSSSCARSGSPTAAGCSTASTPAASTSTSRTASGRRAGGTRCGRCGCSTGGTGGPVPEADRPARAGSLVHRAGHGDAPPTGAMRPSLMDRASASGAEGRRFESFRAHPAGPAVTTARAPPAPPRRAGLPSPR